MSSMFRPSLLALLLLLSSSLWANPKICSVLYADSKLAPYFAFQINDSCCSLASSTNILNAMLAKKFPRTYSYLDQEFMMRKVASRKWFKAISENGDGVTLAQLEKYFQESLKKLDIDDFSVSRIHFDGKTSEQKQNLISLLEGVNNNKDDYVIVNFLQKEFTLDPAAIEGHFSPLGKYNTATQKVLILDTDSSTTGAYWIDIDTMLRGMATVDTGSGLHRGLLLIQKK